MRVAITGGTGFVGRHLARRLAADGHEVALIARGVDQRDESVRRAGGILWAPASVSDEPALRLALDGCDAAAHLAGINREIGDQTYARVHIEGTRAVVRAARDAGLKKIVMLSFLRARPGCGSPYHESKWAAEEIVRNSGLDFTVVKAGIIYGRGDHMLDHLSRVFHTLPLFATVGFEPKRVRPLAINDLVRVLEAALVVGRLSRQTVAVTGPGEMTLPEAVRRVSVAARKRPLTFPLPILFHRILAMILERAMTVPLVSRAQIRILSEGLTKSVCGAEDLPADLEPHIPFTVEQIRKGLPEPGGFGLGDLRCCRAA